MSENYFPKNCIYKKKISTEAEFSEESLGKTAWSGIEKCGGIIVKREGRGETKN